MQLSNKLVWITGASSGIGEQLAYSLIKRGARLIISSRDLAKLEYVKANCEEMGGECHICPLDLSNAQQVEKIADKVLSRFDTIDLLINNGGVSQRSKAMETDMEVERKIMETNFFGAVAITKKVLPNMISNGKGHIAVTSSITGKFGFKLRSSYAASKHALHGYFESLRLELADKNINVTIVCPGFIKTEISKSALTKDGLKHAKMDQAQQGGLSPEKCSEIYIKAIEKNRKEKLIGGNELMMVHFKRFLPILFNKIAARVNAV